MAGTPAPTARERRRAEREVRRALSEKRAIALWAGFVASSHVAGFALLIGDLRLMLIAGVPAIVFFFVVCGHAEPEPVRPRGEIARMSAAEFERLLASVDREAAALAAGGRQAGDPERDADGFARLVGQALDDLPDFLQDELEQGLPVVISDDGASHGKHGCYGVYMGGTVANRAWGSRIVIFRDTLERDYGSDPETLRRLVTMTVRHEMGHHLGAGEREVSDLGLYDLTGPRAAKPPRVVNAPRPPIRGSRATTSSVWSARAVALPPPARARTRSPLPSSTHTRGALSLRASVVSGSTRAPPHPARPPPAEVLRVITSPPEGRVLAAIGRADLS